MSKQSVRHTHAQPLVTPCAGMPLPPHSNSAAHSNLLADTLQPAAIECPDNAPACQVDGTAWLQTIYLPGTAWYSSPLE